jgi:hypothetical protein
LLAPLALCVDRLRGPRAGFRDGILGAFRLNSEFPALALPLEEAIVLVNSDLVDTLRVARLSLRLGRYGWYPERTVATRPTIFKRRQTEPGVILCAVRWYLRYSLSLRDVEELLLERAVAADHTTVWRWVQRYGPDLELRVRRHLNATNKSWAR